MQNEFFEASKQTVDIETARPPGTYRAKIVKCIQDMSHRHDTWRVFSDFVEIFALTLSNSADLAQFEKREARYFEIIKAYSKEELDQFARMFAHLIEELELATDDVLGQVFHELELHNKYKGQYFTPMPLARAIALMTLRDAESLRSIIDANGCIRASEDACGSAVLTIALADEMRAVGINYQQWLHVTATDVDARAVHMAYVQLSLLHIPAIVVHGNSLSLEEFGRWYTPAHIYGGWNFRLRRARSAAVSEDGSPAAEAMSPNTDQLQLPKAPDQLDARKPEGPQLTLF